MVGLGILLSTFLIGAEPAAEPPSAAAAVRKGTAYLEKEAERWRTEKKCATCHHVPMAIWALNEAKRSGYPVDDALLERFTAWTLSDPEAKVYHVPGSKNPSYSGVEMVTVYASLALSGLPAWDDRARNAWSQFAAGIIEKQSADGSFLSGVGRPPIFERPEATTALVALALSAPGCEAAKIRDVSAERGRALKWLAETPTGGSHQALVLRLLLATGPGGSADAVKALSADLVKRQSPDGSWSQAPEMPGDALATGQSLYALRAGGLAADDPVIRRGVDFLVNTQKPEGNWAMTSRPILDQPTGGPAKDLSPITCAGSAWAVLGLARAAPKPPSS